MLGLMSFTTDELLNELARRSHAVIVAWTEDDRQAWHGYHSGGAVTAVGLCESLKAVLMMDCVQDRDEGG